MIVLQIRKLILFCASVLLAVMLGSWSTDDASPSIAVYDHDSVMVTLPGYQVALDSIKDQQTLWDVDLKRFEADLQNRKDEVRQDSAKWSALILGLKKMEIEDMEARVEVFKLTRDNELAVLRSRLFLPLNDTIKAAANRVAKSKKLGGPMEKHAYLDYQAETSSEKSVNITREVIAEIKKQT
jgi:Skp family chaperone for outer membrane proteins